MISSSIQSSDHEFVGTTLDSHCICTSFVFCWNISTYPSMTNGSWDFVDTFGPPQPPQSTVSTTSLMVNLAIPYVLCSNPIVTPITSGTQYISGSTPFVLAPAPSTSATYRAPYNSQNSMVSMGPFN